MVTLTLEKEHGYAIAVAISSVPIMIWAAVKVVKARTKYNVPVPTMYADSSNPHATEFNCVQRAHQNILENYPPFLLLMTTGSIFHPGVAAVLGAIRLNGFIFYVRGYSKGIPDKRRNVFSMLGYLGLFGLLGLSIDSSIRLIRQ
mmetsp:Transcript_1663/g.2476  ORF Transcript_1663/g.2476 Transcript_1663/m.2476 type:complete len:145 (-) Transcript_1663:54-488(-)